MRSLSEGLTLEISEVRFARLDACYSCADRRLLQLRVAGLNRHHPGSHYDAGQSNNSLRLRPSTRVKRFARISSGTSVPLPRTCRNIWPRLTLSGQTVDISTAGAAGFGLERPTVVNTTKQCQAT
ncbi:MAG: hypothetical protein WKF84_22435 [Pyrinomonadaceae bacterium]